MVHTKKRSDREDFGNYELHYCNHTSSYMNTKKKMSRINQPTSKEEENFEGVPSKKIKKTNSIETIQLDDGEPIDCSIIWDSACIITGQTVITKPTNGCLLQSKPSAEEGKLCFQKKVTKNNKSGETIQLDDDGESSECSIIWDSAACTKGQNNIIKPINGCLLKSKSLTYCKDYRPIMIERKLSDTFVFIMTQAKKSTTNVHSRLIIEDSAHYSQIQMNIGKTWLPGQSKWECVFLLCGKVIASSQHQIQKKCLRNLFSNAFSILIKTHYQIIITDKTFSSVPHFMSYLEDIRQSQGEKNLSITITKEILERKIDSSNSSSNAAQKILSEGENFVAPPVKSAVAEKMMKLMGWTEGTGLGMKKQGIVEPIIRSELDVVGREGIGFDGLGDRKSFTRLIRQNLYYYMKNNSLENIVFSKDFSSEQRNIIQDVARQMGMVSNTFGKEPDRQTTVRRSPCTPRPLVELLNQLKQSMGLHPLFGKVVIIPPTK